MRRLLIGLLLSVSLFAQTPAPGAKAAARQPQAQQQGWQRVAAQFRQDNVRAHQRFLSSDTVEGRGTGQRGGQIAMEYIAAQFELAGLKPAVNGSYMQPVPLVGVETQSSSQVAFARSGRGEQKLNYLTEYVGDNETLEESVRIDAPVVFVGYGIEAPQYNWDDYKGVDLRGQVALMLVNEPSSEDPDFFGGKALTYFGRWTYKYEMARKKGAVAAILIHTTPTAGYSWEVVRNSWGRENAHVRPAAGAPMLKLRSWITEAAARQALQTAGQDLDKLMAAAFQRDFRPVALGTNFRAQVQSKIRPMNTANIVGILEGSDARLKDQAVIYTAHHDHFGVGKPVNGDPIYHGAADNASGVGILLELARAFSSAGVRPKRSIVFAAVTAEEQGLLGSEYYALHPVIPAGKTALNINYDGIQFWGRVRTVSLRGVERTTVEPVAQQAARELDFKIIPDEHPEQGYYYRSDHFSFAKVGVPGLSLGLGTDVIGKPAGWGAKADEDYRARSYHQPSDKFDPNWDYSAAKQAAEIGIYIGWAVGNQAELPGWKKGDEFEGARQASVK